MSTGLELIPIAIAIGFAATRRREVRAELGEGAEKVYAIPTRMRDEAMLLRALERLGAPVRREERWITTELSGASVTFALPEGADAYDAHFSEELEEELAQEILGSLDEAYVAEVRERVRGTVHSRAAEHGLTVSSETVEPDGSVLITLEIDR